MCEIDLSHLLLIIYLSFFVFLQTASRQARLKLRRRRRSSGARKKRIQAELFNRLKIKKEDGTSRLQNYAKEKYGYPVNYYKRINKYFGLNNSDKINNLEYEVLGKFMENELLKGGHLSSTDNNDFLNSLNVPLDEYSKKKRLNRFVKPNLAKS